jgi:plastocyanin
MMLRPLLVLLLAPVALPFATLAQATIEGVVALPRSHTAPVVNQRYDIVSKGGVIATSPPVAVVYLAGEFPKPDVPLVQQMIQRNLDFEPRLLAVQVGTKVEFPNRDDTYHNVFSYSRPKRFDLGRYRAGEEPVPFQVFDTAGLVTLRCDIHEHMRAVILVLDTPYFVITGTDGKFRLTGLPAGRYTLKAWVDSKTTLERAVELEPGATLQASLP